MPRFSGGAGIGPPSTSTSHRPPLPTSPVVVRHILFMIRAPKNLRMNTGKPRFDRGWDQEVKSQQNNRNLKEDNGVRHDLPVKFVNVMCKPAT